MSLTLDVILHAVTNDTFHSNPKRKRGQQLRPSLTRRVTLKVNRVQDSYEPDVKTGRLRKTGGFWD